MNFRKYIFLGFLICSNFSFACKCAEEFQQKTMVQKGIALADIVFYGELIKSDSKQHNFSFKIIEIFKGHFANEIINGVSASDCDLFPESKGKWIVYGNFTHNNIIVMNMCMPSQSLDFGPGYPEPPIMFDENGKVRKTTATEYQLFDLKDKNKSLSSWIYQLEKLRQYKLSQNTVTDEMKTDLSDKIIIGSLVVNVIFLLTIIGIIVSKKTSNNHITK